MGLTFPNLIERIMPTLVEIYFYPFWTRVRLPPSPPLILTLTFIYAVGISPCGFLPLTKRLSIVFELLLHSDKLFATLRCRSYCPHLFEFPSHSLYAKFNRQSHRLHQKREHILCFLFLSLIDIAEKSYKSFKIIIIPSLK